MVCHWPPPSSDSQAPPVVEPMIVWLWIGGGVMAVGTALAAFPGRRRDPLAPVSAPVAGAGPAGPPEPHLGDETAEAADTAETVRASAAATAESP